VDQCFFCRIRGVDGLPQNCEVAARYRAYATYNRQLKITSPRNDRDLVWDAGSRVTVAVDDSRFAGWKKLELYDGAKKVRELAKGPAPFTVKDLQTGYHAFSVLGTDGKGNIRPSGPVLVVVRKLAASISNDGSPVGLMDDPSKHATGYYANNTPPELRTGHRGCNCNPAEKQPIERVSEPNR
jgi:hypothetical protein